MFPFKQQSDYLFQLEMMMNVEMLSDFGFSQIFVARHPVLVRGHVGVKKHVKF